MSLPSQILIGLYQAAIIMHQAAAQWFVMNRAKDTRILAALKKALITLD